VGGGGWYKQEGTTEHAPCKERGDGAHRGGGAAAARRIPGGDDVRAILARGGRAAELTDERGWRRLLGNFR
jgi:hypothetical protein